MEHYHKNERIINSYALDKYYVHVGVILFIYLFCFLFGNSLTLMCKTISREQDDFRTAKGEEEIGLYNAKKRRVFYGSFRVSL